MTVLRMATQYYDAYTNASLGSVDTAAYARKNYNVKNLSGSLGVVASAKTTNFATLRNVDSFVKNGFSASGLDHYDALKTAVSSGGATKLLSGGTGLSSLYGLLGTQLSIAKEQANELFSPDASSAISGYSKFLSSASVGSLLDITA